MKSSRLSWTNDVVVELDIEPDVCPFHQPDGNAKGPGAGVGSVNGTWTGKGDGERGRGGKLGSAPNPCDDDDDDAFENENVVELDIEFVVTCEEIGAGGKPHSSSGEPNAPDGVCGEDDGKPKGDPAGNGRPGIGLGERGGLKETGKVGNTREGLEDDDVAAFDIEFNAGE